MASGYCLFNVYARPRLKYLQENIYHHKIMPCVSTAKSVILHFSYPSVVWLKDKLSQLEWRLNVKDRLIVLVRLKTNFTKKKVHIAQLQTILVCLNPKAQASDTLTLKYTKWCAAENEINIQTYFWQMTLASSSTSHAIWRSDSSSSSLLAGASPLLLEATSFEPGASPLLLSDSSPLVDDDTGSVAFSDSDSSFCSLLAAEAGSSLPACSLDWAFCSSVLSSSSDEGFSSGTTCA